MKNLCYLVVPLFAVAFAAPAAGQLFPFDRKADAIAADSILDFQNLNAHTKMFGRNEVQLEIYFEPFMETETRPGWEFTVKCTETIFLEKKKVSGETLYPLSDQNGRYLFYFYQDGCFVLTTIEKTPDGATSVNSEAWGNCRKTKKI